MRRAAPVLLALAAVLLAGLGVWQVARRAEKLALIASVDARLKAPPVALAAAPPPYTPVRISGRWLPVAPVFVKAVTDLGGGWWVLSPLASGGGVVLVNRGFVPDAEREILPPPTGLANLTGLVRASEPGGGFLRRNDPAADRWFSRDVPAIARARGLGEVAPVFIDADAGGSGWPRGGMTVVRFPNNHLVYALTWFALAGLAGSFAWRAR